MGSMMESAAVILGPIVNVAIIVLFIVTLGGFIHTLLSTKRIKIKIEETRRKNGGRKEYTKGGIKKAPDVYYWEDNVDDMVEFNKVQVRYAIFEQLVPIFPLLGILGTVAGLIQQLGDREQMQAALGVSMSTTFLGLLAAIVLKFIDAFVVSKSINEMILRFDTEGLNYQMVKDKHDLEDENMYRG